MKKMIAGVDEVGRGSLIGPVYAAAVILKKKINKKKLKDSKKLSKKNREILEKYIKTVNLEELLNIFPNILKGEITGRVLVDLNK